MRPTDAPRRVDHEHAALLPGIPLDRSLAMTLPKGAESAAEASHAQALAEATPQAESPERLPLRIDCDAGLGTVLPEESSGHVRRAAPDEEDIRSERGKRVVVRADLRYLLAAEQSAEVAKKHEHQRAIAPPIREPEALTSWIREREVGGCELQRFDVHRILRSDLPYILDRARRGGAARIHESTHRSHVL
jgi:hypothetical protein